MQQKAIGRGTRGVTPFTLVLAVILLVPFRGSGAARAQQSANPNARDAVQLLDNNRVVMTKLTFAPGRRTDPPGKTHPERVARDGVIIMLTAGEVEVSWSGEPAVTGHVEPGKTWWWPGPPATHSIANVGKEPIEFVQVQLKEPMGKSQFEDKPTVRPGIAHLLENGRVIVEKLTFTEGRRTNKPGETHPEGNPRDVIIMQLTPGRVEISSTGEPAETGQFQPGKTWWWPKPPATHSIANVGNAPFDFIKVSLK